MAKVHSLLPPSARINATPKQGAGARGLGAGGRSLHQALEDLVGYLKGLEAAGRLPRWMPGAEAGPPSQVQHRTALLSCRSLFVVEVESNVLWTMRALGHGAADFFAHAPWGSMEGQSLANLVRCEDIPSLMKIWNPHTARHVGSGRAAERRGALARDGGSAFLCRLHVATFSPPSWKASEAGSGTDANMALDDCFPEIPDAPWRYTPVFVQDLIPVRQSPSRYLVAHGTLLQEQTHSLCWPLPLVS